MKKAVKLIFLSIILLQFSFGQVMINEFSASNHDGFTDNYGRYEDWIELYNPTATPFNLSGYYLSDKNNNPTKWQFPAGVTIPANGVLRVWASGRDEVAGGHVHTSFKITQRQPNPEYVVLADPGGNILESYHLLQYGTQRNHSWGRVSNGNPVWGVFTNPTPNANNAGASYMRYAALPDFNINGGFYPGSQTVSISTSEPNSVIRYTINGNTPDATSPVYAAALNINSTTVVQARVFSNDPQILPGFYEFHTYFINVSHTVPVVSIAGTDVSTLLNGNSGIRPHGCVEYYENNQLEAKVTGEFNKHGNDSWAYQQRGIDFISRDQFGYADALRHGIFNITNRDKFQRVMWKAAANDNYPFQAGGAHIRDAFIAELSQRSGLELDERSYEPCVLYLNGQYWGIYETREKVDDPDFTEYNYDQDRLDLFFLKTWGGTWAEYGGTAATNDWNALRTYIQSNNMGDPTHYAYVDDRLNLLSLIDYFIINTHTVCMDWLNWNTAWWKGTNPAGQAQKWRYTLWDMDATFGHYINYTGIPNTSPNADPCFGQQLPDPGGQGHTSIITKLFNESEEFRQLYVTRYLYLINGPLHCDNMILLLDELVARIAPEMPQHIARWGGNLTTWQNNVQAVRDFINQRCIVVEQGIIDCFGLDSFNIVLLVNPVGAGNIDFNQNNISVFPHSDNYYGTVIHQLFANEHPGYTFSHWEFVNHTPNPGINSQGISVVFNAPDTIIAHYIQGPPIRNLTLIVEPPGSGQVTVNSFTPAVYPWSDDINDGTSVNLIASAFPGYIFSNWMSLQHTLLPNVNTQIVNFLITSNDTVYAYFEEYEEPDIYTLKVNVSPPNSGQVILNSNILIYTTHTENIINPSNINLIANDRFNYLFSHWTIGTHMLIPDENSNSVSFFLTEDEEVTAHFSIDESGIYFPGSFTPNGDGLNDYFSLHTTYQIENCEVMIFTRWGELIYHSKEPDFKWDGNFKGQRCPQEVYVFSFSYQLAGSDVKQSLLGTVTILH